MQIPVLLVLGCPGQHLGEGFDALLALAITLGTGWCGVGFRNFQELGHLLEKPGFKLGALITVEIGGIDVTGSNEEAGVQLHPGPQEPCSEGCY